MIIIRHRVLFFVENSGLLRCRVKWDGSRNIVAVNVGFRVDPDKWDATAQECKARSYHGESKTPASVINDAIRRYRQVIEQVFEEYGAADHVPTVDELRPDLRRRLGLDKPKSRRVKDLSREFFTEQGSVCTWSEGTIKKFRTVFAHLADWRPELEAGELDEDGLNGFVTYLRDVKKHRNSSIKKQMGYVRQFCRWCEEKGLLKSHDWSTFHPKLKEAGHRVIFLTPSELERVRDLAIPPERPDLYREVRDMFVFCCYTSLRYSDAQNLRWTEVHPTTIRVCTVKTGTSLVIELNQHSRRILDDYVLEDYPGNYVFPRIPNQVMNRYLKEICRWADISEPVRTTWYQGAQRLEKVQPKHELIGTHTARRTFICQALSMGIPPQVVMKWTGHADYDTMRPYIDITRTATREAMDRFND